MTRPTLAQAQAAYQHRFTMEHVPAWARDRRPDGTYYAPQYESDEEWYRNTTFPGEPSHLNGPKHCNSTRQSWPLGTFLSRPYSP